MAKNTARSVIEHIKEQVVPSDKEQDEALRRANAFLKKLNEKLKAQKVKAKAVLGGSYAKGTWLAGDYDVDVFVKFDCSYQDDEMSDALERALQSWDAKRLHGSRDYFWVEEEVRYEIVPVLDIKSPEDARNVTDFSPLHVDWVNEKGEKLKDDIRLAKKFCKAAKCYGAESYIRGFSGHTVDILTIHYKGFQKLLKAATEWSPKVVVDPEKKYKGRALLLLNKSKTEGPLVVIDPVQPNRNAAAALTKKNFDRFVEAAKEFLKNPSVDCFEVTQVDLEKLAKKGKVVTVEVATLDKTEDVAGTKFVRAFEFVRRHLEEFGIKDAGWLWDKKEKGAWWFVLESAEIPEMAEQKGPPLELEEAVKKFKKAHKSTFEKSGRVWAKVAREHRTPKEVLSAVLKDRYVKQRVKRAKV